MTSNVELLCPFQEVGIIFIAINLKLYIVGLIPKSTIVEQIGYKRLGG